MPETTRLGIAARLRAWPAARNGDALNAAYVGKLMVEAADDIERLRTALAHARNQFSFYAVQHDAKGTADSAKKAQVNRDMVALCNAALNGEDPPDGIAA